MSHPAKLTALVKELLENISGVISPEQMTETLANRGIVRQDPLPEVVADEDLRDNCSKDEEKDVKDCLD